MNGNNFEVIGKFAENYLDQVLVHESVYAKFLPDNRGLNEDFYERGWVKLLSVLVSGFGFYRISNEANVIVTADSDAYADYNGNVAADNRAGYKIGSVSAKWTLYDLQDKLKQSGWMIPAYTLPKSLEDVVVMRVVIKQGFTRDMADMMLADMRMAVDELEKLQYPTQSRIAFEKQEKQKGKVFTH